MFLKLTPHEARRHSPIQPLAYKRPKPMVWSGGVRQLEGFQGLEETDRFVVSKHIYKQIKRSHYVPAVSYMIFLDVCYYTEN